MNKLQYLFTCLAEECAEVAQMCSKINRFGVYDKYPEKDSQTNLTRLNKEISDLFGVLEMIRKEGLWVGVDICDMKDKIDKVSKYMKISEKIGALVISDLDRSNEVLMEMV
jgi:NTP pyrophosphatase (non-canonical NTP hydrolase)